MLKIRRYCAMCKIEPIYLGRQIYCGSYKRKVGCSYIHKLEKHRVFYKKWYYGMSEEKKKKFNKYQYKRNAKYYKYKDRERYKKLKSP